MVSELHRVEVHDAVTGPGKRGQCESAETRQVMQACVWAEWRTVGVVVGVLNDEEHEQDKDDPSSTHHDDRGVRLQFGVRRSPTLSKPNAFVAHGANCESAVQFCWSVQDLCPLLSCEYLEIGKAISFPLRFSFLPQRYLISSTE